MLKSHINAIEKVLISQSQIASYAGHTNLRGGPREWFIREFLESHLPSTLENGQGEIIDSNSIPRPSPANYRPQVDVVIYRRDLPKISYSRNDAAYLVEGVVATIESKSTLTNAELENANKASITHSNLTRGSSSGMSVGRTYNKPFNYLIAYDGPANMQTVSQWMIQQVQTSSFDPIKMVDMIIILGKGVLWKLSSFPALPVKGATSNNYWAYIDQADNNLLLLFIHMLSWVASYSTPPNTMGYASNIGFTNIRVV